VIAAQIVRSVAVTDLKPLEYYWLNAIGISTAEPLMIGRYLSNGRWWIDGKVFTAGPGIEVIKHIRKPTFKFEE